VRAKDSLPKGLVKRQTKRHHGECEHCLIGFLIRQGGHHLQQNPKRQNRRKNRRRTGDSSFPMRPIWDTGIGGKKRLEAKLDPVGGNRLKQGEKQTTCSARMSSGTLRATKTPINLEKEKPKCARTRETTEAGGENRFSLLKTNQEQKARAN